MQMAPGYRDAFQIYLTVSKGLALEGNIYRMSVKDVAVLYEYWTFLKIGQILASKYELVSQDIVQVSRDGLYVNLLGNKKAKRVFRHPITKEKIELIYQHTHRNLPTTSQIPDSMLRIKKKGKDYTFDYIFDAKYRIDYAQEGSTYQLKYKTPGPLEEDINTMHRYRDAIVANYNGPYERTAFGAYVLFPWYDEYSYQEHQFYKSIDKVNIGGLPFLPNATILVEKLIERLIDKSAEELQKEGILPRGTLEDWISVLDEKVLVGLVSSHHDYYNYIRRNYYSIETKYLRKNWQEANYVALYLKQGISNTENGVTLYGRINEVTIQNNTVYFHIDHWKNLKNVIKPVNYGIATYIMTTLKMLQEATELPELFMKSTDEMILWRILRRVSDQIKVELDQPIIDQAQTIKTYRFNNILIKINRQQNELLFMNNQISKSVPLDLLKKKPTNVFKELVSIMQA